MHEIDFTRVGLLLFLSSIAAKVTRRLNLPYSDARLGLIRTPAAEEVSEEAETRPG